MSRSPRGARRPNPPQQQQEDNTPPKEENQDNTDQTTGEENQDNTNQENNDDNDLVSQEDAPPPAEEVPEVEVNPVDQYVEQFNKAKDAYVELMSSRFLRRDDFQRGIRLHRVMTHLLIDNQEDTIYDLYWNFHVEQSGRDDERAIGRLMSEEFALRGIDQIEEPIGDRISILYTLFRNYTVGDDRGIDEDQAIRVLSYREGTNPAHLLEYLARRARVISRL